MSDSTIAKMIRELKDKIKELEQQLAELSEKYIQVEALAAQYALEAGKVDLIDLMKELQSPALVNQMKAEAIREFISHIKGMSDEDQKLKGRFQAELFWKGAFAVHEFGIDYAKQLEGGE